MKYAAIILAALLLAGGYYYFFYPPEALQHQAQAMLDTLDNAVAAKDRAKISRALQAMLSRSAHIRLSVTFYAITRPQGTAPVEQDFTREQFITFVDNVLYSLTDYAYAWPPRIESFALAPDHKTAQLVFTSKEWGDGPSYVRGIKLDTRFSSDTRCDVGANVAASPPAFDTMTCTLALRIVPKPGQEKKLGSNPETMLKLLSHAD